MPRDPEHLVSLTELDATVVRALGATQAANAIRLALRAAGLQPRTYAGTETVACVLGLRTNHPQGEEYLGARPAESRLPARGRGLARPCACADRAEGTSCSSARGFALPRLDTVQTAAVLRRAVRFIGCRYVWAGTSESPQALATGLAPGGFDCSGLAPGACTERSHFPRRLLLGGTPKLTMFSRPRSVPAPSDCRRSRPSPEICLFGTRGPASTPQEMGHMGIALAPGWFLHSSGNGVTLQPAAVRRLLAWARSPIREAGLA